MSRFNGYIEDDLIQTPGLIVESLMKDEIKTEIDLELDSISGADAIVYNTSTTEADYYKDAFLFNVSKNERYKITSNASNTLTLESSPTGWVSGDRLKIINIQPDIDENSFDVIQAKVVASSTTSAEASYKLIKTGASFTTQVLPGMTVKNVTDATYTTVKAVDSNTQLSLEDNIFTTGEEYAIYGKRGLWSFDRALTAQENSLSILSKLMYESHCILFKSQNKYKIVALDQGGSVGTLSTPLIQNGTPQVFPKLTSLRNLYSDFTLNYGYSHTSKTYRKQIIVNKNSSGLGYLDYLKTNCATVENDYKVKSKWEYDADWIQDDTTAGYFLEQIILWHTYQRLHIEWHGGLSDHLKYEIGDKVYIDFDLMLPLGKNLYQQFTVIGKSWSKKKVVLHLYS